MEVFGISGAGQMRQRKFLASLALLCAATPVLAEPDIGNDTKAARMTTNTAPVPPETLAQPIAQVPLTLERIFASPSINGATPRLVRLSPDGKLLTSLRPRADDRDRFDLWATDTTTGASRMLVDSTKLGTTGELSEAEKMQRERARIGGTRGIVAYDWSADSASILVPVDGDLFLADLNGGVTRLTNSKSGELDAVVSQRADLSRSCATRI